MNFILFILYLLFSFVELCVLFAVSILRFIGSIFMWFFGLVEWINRPPHRK